MHKRTKIIIGALTVALALAAAIGTASARRIELSQQRFLVLFAELTFQGVAGAEPRVICPVNLEGSFHSRTLSKVCGQLIGYITEARVNHPCRQNEAWVLNGIERKPEGITVGNTLPWHILYLRFLGTLPTITGIEVQLNNGGFLVEALGVKCLYEATRAAGMKGLITVIREAGGGLQATTLSPTAGATIAKHEGGILCPANGELAGSGDVRSQGEWSLITIRLVQ